MALPRFVFFICILTISLTSARPSSNEVDDVKAWRHNFNTAMRFSCKHPQPRAILAEELLKGQLGTSEKPIPYYTVLHRCDSQSGCCLAHQECSVAEQKPVTLWFKKQDIGKFSYVSVTEYNHTRCACIEKNDLPKRYLRPDVFPVRAEITSGQAAMDSSGLYLFLLGCVLCLIFISILVLAF